MDAGISKKQPRGRPFKPGQSGNPSGRPRLPDDLREMTRSACPDAIRYLVSVMSDDGEKTAYRLDAAKTLLDRGYGKAMQMQDISFGVQNVVDVQAQIRRLLLKEDKITHVAEQDSKD